jgi:hypothetical protein
MQENNMSMHDWKRVPAGIFHAFHHRWIDAISDTLNAGLLPSSYYALPEQLATRFGPDVLTLQHQETAEADETEAANNGPATATMARPKTRFVVESESEVFRQKKFSVAVRHVSGDRLVSMVEIVSPGNKAGKKPFAAFIDKACSLLEQRIHLLIIDPFAPTARDPNGIHSAIWEAMQGESFSIPGDKPLTIVSYECEVITRAYIEPIAVGDHLPDMPLFLKEDDWISVPLDKTYDTTYSVMPRRWQRVLEGKKID